MEKDKNKNIFVIPLNDFNTKTEKLDAIQPVYEALQLPKYEVIYNIDSIVIVEGIYDKYVVEVFCGLENNILIMPSTSADAIIKNIQYLITFGKKYVAIWDNDEEWKKCFEKAKKIFGLIEANRFDVLPSIGKSERRMEQMFSSKDIVNLKKLLDLNTNANYESVISQLFYSKSNVKTQAKRIIQEETIKNFEILNNIIKKRFKYPNNIIE